MIDKNYIKNISFNCVIFTAENNFISNAICAIQSIFTLQKYKIKSNFSHAVMLIDGWIYESTISVNGKNIYGCTKTKKDIFFSDKNINKYKILGIQKLNLNKPDWDKIKQKAEKMIKDKTKYGTLELLGTLNFILKWTFASKKNQLKMEQTKNIFNKSNVYCIAYVADCINANISKLKYIDMDHSIIVVDEGWIDCKIGNTKIELK